MAIGENGGSPSAHPRPLLVNHEPRCPGTCPQS
jgi:hypothetical protein